MVQRPEMRLNVQYIGKKFRKSEQNEKHICSFILKKYSYLRIIELFNGSEQIAMRTFVSFMHLVHGS